jgi:hypothetical protein
MPQKTLSTAERGMRRSLKRRCRVAIRCPGLLVLIYLTELLTEVEYRWLILTVSLAQLRG